MAVIALIYRNKMKTALLVRAFRMMWFLSSLSKVSKCRSSGYKKWHAVKIMVRGTCRETETAEMENQLLYAGK